MTGTAADATGEMEHVYSRPVMVIPTNRPVVRKQGPVRAFATREAKWEAIVRSIEELHGAGRPLLVGTRSIEASEFLMMLRLQHQVEQARERRAVSNYVDPESLSHLQRALLKEAFQAIARAQSFAESRFRTAVWAQLQ